MYIFPLPYSSFIEKDGMPTLSAHSQLVADAALKITGHTDTPVLIGEQTYKGPGSLTAELMHDYLVRAGFQNANLRVVTRAFNNTVQQLTELKKHIGDNDVLLIACAFHAPRVRLIAGRVGLHFTVRTAEDILATEAVVRTDLKLPLSMLLTEKLLYVLMFFDSRGTMQNWYTNFRGPRSPLV